MGQFKQSPGNGRVLLMDIYEIRYQHLMRLLKVYKAKDLADLADTNPGYISQVKTRRFAKGRGTPARIGDELARKFEKGLNKPHGWMDKLHDDTAQEFMDLKEKGVIFPTPNIPFVPWGRLITGGEPMIQTEKDKAALRTTAEVFQYSPDSVVTEIGGELLLIDCGAGPLPGKRVHVWVEGRGDLIRRYEKEGDVAFLLDPAGQLPAIEISDEINHLYKGRVVLTLTIE